MENLRRSLSPKINFNFPTVKLPESALKSISVASSLAAQDAWKQFGVINSDIFRMHAANQTQFAKLSTQLTKNLDFGFSESLSKITQQVAAQQASWLRTLGPTLQKLEASFYPPNLRAIEGMYFEDVEKVVMADGIALYGVPRTAIAEALIRADSAAKRREIVGSRWKAISADCRVAVLACQSDPIAPYVPFAVAALDALDGGDTAAAQALVGSLIDSLLTAYLAWTGPTSHRTAKARGRPPPMKSSPSVSSSRSRLCGWRISSSGWRTATAFPRLSAATPGTVTSSRAATQRCRGPAGGAGHAPYARSARWCCAWSRRTRRRGTGGCTGNCSLSG